MRRLLPFCLFAATLAPILGSGHRAMAADEPATAPPPAVVLEDTVVVRAAKLPWRLRDIATSVTVVSSKDMHRGTAHRIQDAIGGVPGMHLLDLAGNDALASVEARGFASQGTSSHMLVLVDEVPINDFEGDRVDWGQLGLSQVRRVELMRGPASFLYGDASMSGVVNLVTRGDTPGSSAWLEGVGGSYGRAQGAGGLSWGGDRDNGALSLESEGMDGWRDHSELRNTTGYGSFAAGMGASWSAQGRLLIHALDQDVPGPVPAPVWSDHPQSAGTPIDHRRDRLGRATVSLNGRLSSGLEAVIIATGEKRNLDATETIIPGGTMNRTSNTRVGTAELRLHWTPASHAVQQVLVGGNIEYGTLESRYFDRAAAAPRPPIAGGDPERLSGGVFAVAQARPIGLWTLTAGARLDWLRSSLDPLGAAPRGPNDDLRAFSPSLGLSHPLPDGGIVYASYAKSFKAPTIEQLYDQRPFNLGFGPITISYSGLKPQKADHVEIGARSRLGRSLWAEGTVFGLKARDEIGFDLAALHHSNIDRSVHYGFEGQLSTVPWKGLSAQASYALTRALFDGGEHGGKQINTVPEHILHGRLAYDHAVLGSLTLDESYVLRQWIDEENNDPLPDYAITDLALSHGVGRFEVFGALRNLFDRRYASLGYVTLDPVTFGPLPLYYPGAGRTLQLGLRVRGSHAMAEHKNTP
jgi:outer membrane receptor protein involved in Fe transport